MSELEVEAVEDLDAPSVAAGTAEYVLYGGKGGVGKTTMAAATGLASATDGTPTLVVSTDPAHSLSDTYGVDVPSQPGRLREDVPLWGVEIDPDEAMERAGAMGLGGEDGAGPMGGLGDLLGGAGDEMATPLGGPMPGADEAAAMQLLVEYLDDERFERVVVDTAPTGHTLRLLELPELMDSMMGRMLQFREKMGGMMDSMKGLFGGGADADAGMAGVEEVRERVTRLRAVLTDPARTDFRIVTVPEGMSVTEAKRLRERLAEFGIPVSTVVVNKVMEPLVDVVPEVPAETFVSPNLDACAFCQRRWDVQQDALAEAQDLFRGHDVKRVPLLAEEVRGPDALRVVAACLA
ncbi:arsenite-transporting ATPase [Halarchaeum rubridurum]|uniref:Arsenic-transporting ATPase n=1 Tax=Halarchaeum rubridurum TaxID=489911 RepID=A0A830FPG7_9EURY|nr:TRC40/GET3/ArsA family transport-energizing ATPase [Halarchaeum rubridurum]MBP1955261.1 arsenite-transporting ATPase [Halarchaeum rubridurum]GGM67774.1 arsenic-transporting ATPase [Halarchaeum rubridurum]